MGYTTEFNGNFNLNRELDEDHAAYLLKFSEVRHMKRDTDKITFKDKIRNNVNLYLGLEGEYFVGGKGYMGQDDDESILDYNRPPATQPGLWCQWVPTEDNDGIEWDGGEKFYNYIEWLEYIIKHFLIPWGYILNGSVEWRGEDWEDTGTITVEDNRVRVYRRV